MVICCLVIEALESFYQGNADTRGAGEKTFGEFFARPTPLSVFGHEYGEGADWFYKNISCGILHQSETKGGWRIHRKDLLLDTSQKSINAAAFLSKLRKTVETIRGATLYR
jgi:hypothetical protein